MRYTDNGGQTLEAMLMSSANVELVKQFLCFWDLPIEEAEWKLKVSVLSPDDLP